MVSSAFAAVLATVLVLPRLSQAASSSYTLADAYDSKNFLDSWAFFDQQDPTGGFVKYVGSDVAQSTLLASKTTTGNIFLGSDKGDNGRSSVRISSKKAYKYHLMIADIVHAPTGSGPGGSCGIWPALWELGGPDQWPIAGEIDIYEGVNSQSGNQMTLHTNQGCTVNNNQQSFTGNMTTTDCNVSNGANGNAGCAVAASGPDANSSFGAGFNAVGGGVYATEVTPQGIKIWHFPRNAIPSDIAQQSPNPDPSTWGLPSAAFSGSCDIDQHFKNLNIVINTAFCGDWAGKVWDQPQANGQPSCQQLTGVSTCSAYVAAHPEAFLDAYWEINRINVYSPSSGPAKRDDEGTSEDDFVRRNQPSGILEKRKPEATLKLFSQPSGAAYDSCEQLTPGHCGDSNRQTATSAATKVKMGGTAALVILLSALLFA